MYANKLHIHNQDQDIEIIMDGFDAASTRIAMIFRPPERRPRFSGVNLKVGREFVLLNPKDVIIVRI